MRVIQPAVAFAGAGVVIHPADLLNDIRARFLAHDTWSLFSWASRLRMYGKKVRDSTTYLWYISWSDDRQLVSYKDVSCLGMEKLRAFIGDQVAKA